MQDIRDRLQAFAGQPSAPSGAVTLWAAWRDQMGDWIDEQPSYSATEKQDLKDQIGKIQAESERGTALNTGRLEKLINTLAVIGPDVFQVVTATLANPLAGIGVALKKIGDRARLAVCRRAPCRAGFHTCPQRGGYGKPPYKVASPTGC